MPTMLTNTEIEVTWSKVIVVEKYQSPPQDVAPDLSAVFRGIAEARGGEGRYLTDEDLGDPDGE